MSGYAASTNKWEPKLDDLVWMNQPDFGKPLGKVVGFVQEGHPREGQPIIECIEDEKPTGSSKLSLKLAHKKGDRFVIAPMFLLPFEYGGKQWQKANKEGRIG